MSFKFKPIKYARANVPVLTFAPLADSQLNAARIVERNASRRELVLCEAAGSDTFVSGQPFTGLEGHFGTGYGGRALDTNGIGRLNFPVLVLPGYVGELYAIGAGVPTNLQLGELVDTAQRERESVIPVRMLTRFFGAGSLPVNGAGVAPAKILQADPDGLRLFVMLTITFGSVLLTTRPTPVATQQVFQYGFPGLAVPIDNPLWWTVPYVPRSGLFATGDAAGHRLFVTEGFGR